MVRFWRWLKELFSRLFGRKRFTELPVFAEPLEKELAEVDWRNRDVLVGSLGTAQQLGDNLEGNYYYVPACHIDSLDLPVRYVAIYQSRTLFGEQAGIRYYGEVLGTEQVQRSQIRFPVIRDNGEEHYYRFHVKRWEILPRPIKILDAWVREPRFTCFFLLNRAVYSYELFGTCSERDFRVAAMVRKLLEGEKRPFVCRLRQDRTMTLKKSLLTIRDAKGKTQDVLSLEELRESPGSALHRIRWAIR